MIHISNNNRLSIITVCFLTIGIFSLGGCTLPDEVTQGHSILNPLYGRFQGPYIDVIAQPDFAPLSYRIGIFNFTHTTALEDLGFQFAQYAHKHFLRSHLVSRAALTGEDVESLDDAVEIGQSRNLDFILIGHITEFFDGGITANSKVSVVLKVVDVKNGTPVWFVAGHMEGGYRKHTDYILLKERTKEAPAPSLLSAVLMREMLKVLAAN